MSVRSLSSAAAILVALPAIVLSQSPQQPTFRAGVELIAVDIHVVDRDGREITGLTPDKFTVTIDGRKRRVVSADLINYGSGEAAAAARSASAPELPRGRFIMLAVDCTTFDATVSHNITTAAREFISKLLPDDEIGLFAYPLGPKLNPTTDHASVMNALNSVVGQSDRPTLSQFHLRPSEIIDLSLWADSPGTVPAPAIVAQLCGPNEQCADDLIREVKGLALYYEGKGNATLGMFRGMLKNLGQVPGRKMVVLVSAGQIASDTPGGRPNLNEMGLELGREASHSDVTVYTLFIDQSWLEQNSAETSKPRNTQTNFARDSAVLGRWLEQFSGMAGGAMMKVMFGGGEFAFDRVLSETSAYYLVGVEPGAEDRDGRAHAINVKVSRSGATVRGRSWVVVPKASGIGAGSSPATSASVRAAPTPAASAAAPADVLAPPPRAPLGPLAPLAAAFERGDGAAVHDSVSKAPDLGRLIREYRSGGPIWPEAPRRDPVFALDLALAGLRSRDQATRDDAVKLLVEYHTRVRQQLSADVFECSWYLTEAAGLEGLFQQAATLPLIIQGLQRCPNEAKLALARAIVTEQDWPLTWVPTLDGAAAPTEQDLARDIPQLYDEAAKSPVTAVEARVRAAWYFYRTGALDRARAQLDQIHPPIEDARIRYLNGVVRGQVLRAQNQLDGAEAAFRDALAALPGGQSARVALMTLLLSRGNRQDAESLAVAVQTSPDPPFDPWWVYWLGDYPVYLQYFTRLREMAR